MKNKTLICLVSCISLLPIGCSKDDSFSGGASRDVSLNSRGATQVDGIGYFDATDVCNFGGQGATFAITLTGDLVGCDYFFVEEFECSPSGTYREIGRELFIGTYKGQAGTFRTTYKFEGKYEGCAADGSYIGAEILGRCQHPLVEGSGTGVFEGVTGRLDFKDDIDAGNYPYRGHLRW